LKSVPYSYIVEFDDPQATDSSIVGSKSASVADLVAQGARVPSGFSVPATVFDGFVAPIAAKIATILKTVNVDEVSSSFTAADAISKLLIKQAMPDGLASAIERRVSDSSSILAVRSSATAEDLEGASFAGMYDTFLDATDSGVVLKRIRDVWISYYTGRAISYRTHQGFPHESGSMAVLIMELIDAEAGGVVFTRDPRDSAEHILINAALGLGEGVVSGLTEADSFTVDPTSLDIIARNVVDKEWMFVSTPDGSAKRVPVPADKRSIPALTDAQLVAVAKIATAIKNAAGDDRDIEFAVKNDEVHILQSRPVTTGVAKSTDFPVIWENPEDEKLHWRTGGREPLLPLAIDQSLMSGIAEKRSVDITGQEMGRRDLRKLVNGYMYSAESPRDPEETKSRLLKHHLHGRRYLEKGTTHYYEEVEPLLLRNLEEIELVRSEDSAPIPDHIANLRRAMQLGADHMSDLHWQCWAGFKDGDTLATLFSEITGQPKLEAAVLILGIDHMTARLSRRLIGLAELVNSDDWLSKVFEARDYESLFARGAGKRTSVRRFRTRFQLMLKVWGRRNGIGYGSAWKPTDPTWNMKPEIPLDSIGSFARQDLSELNDKLASLVEKRKSAIAAVRKKVGRNKKLRTQFELELFKGTHHVKMMENHNYLIEQRTYGELRESIYQTGTALTGGGWIDDADDIFYLRLHQLEESADAGDYSDLRSSIIEAKAERVENSKLERPDFLGTKPPEKEKPEGEEPEPLRGISKDGMTLHGDPSSAGQFTGRARVVITRTSTPPDVKKGDVLVTENTGPDWVPIFPLIGALVLDSGDNFQHASLISREYGIPCVIQTKEATVRIFDGQMITVDGTAGTVALNPII